MASHNSAGYGTPNADRLYFKVSTGPLPSPILVSPGTGSAPGLDVPTTTPTFQWQSVTGADGYALYISKYNGSGYDLVFDSSVNGGPLTGTSYILPNQYKLEEGKQYRWNMASHNSAGYGDPNIDRFYFTVGLTIVGYPDAIWKGPAAEGNYEFSRGDYTKPDLIILHTIVLSGDGWQASAALSRFKTPGEEASAHYIIRQNGEIWQVVSDSDTAYHAGNFSYNQRSIGVEMEGWADGKPDVSWQTDALYNSLQDLIKWLSEQYGIPLDREHIIGHNQVPGVDKDGCAPPNFWGGCDGGKFDPGPYWNWMKLMKGLGQSINYVSLSVEKNCSILTLPQSEAPSFIDVWQGQRFVAHDFSNGYYLISISGQESSQPPKLNESGEYHWDGWISSSCVNVDSNSTQLEVNGIFPDLLDIYDASSNSANILAHTIDDKRYIATGNEQNVEGKTWKEFYMQSIDNNITKGWAISANLSVVNSNWITNPVNGHFYKLVSGETWQECEDKAVVQGAHLLTINDEDEQKWLITTFGVNKRYWIGYTDKDEEGTWKWISGDPSDYTNWADGEPNNWNDCEDYAEMNWTTDGKWNDSGPCSSDWSESKTAIIEKKDEIPPKVVSTSPPDGTTDVAVNTTITATFSKAMDGSTISNSTFTVKMLPNLNNVSGTVTYDDKTKTATFKPVENLNYLTEYYVTITNGVKDTAGNSMEKDYPWKFKTAESADTTAPFINSTSPHKDETDVAVNTTITVTFSESMDASTINNATFIVKLLPANNEITGTVTYDDTTKTAVFKPAENLNYTTKYYATITAGVKDLSGNPMEKDYPWFFTTAATDTTPPSVVSTSPQKDETDVPVNTTITVAFSESMDASTISDSTFTVKKILNQYLYNLTGKVTYDDVTKTATFTPSGNLSYSTEYTATITKEVKDLAGNSMADDYPWSFTTIPVPTDTIPPDGSIIMSDGAEYTKTSDVTLNLSAQDNVGVVAYLKSEDSTKPLPSDERWESVDPITTDFSKEVSFKLSDIDSTKTVHVWYKDAAGNVSEPASDAITLDTISPTVDITNPATNPYVTLEDKINLAGTAEDVTSGVKSVTWENDKGGSGSATGTTNWNVSDINLVAGTNTITVMALDNAGNPPGSDEITITRCTYTLSPEKESFDPQGGEGSFEITTVSESCCWSAQSDADWIEIKSVKSACGGGKIDYAVNKNETTEGRDGTITIENQIFTVHQKGKEVCTDDFEENEDFNNAYGLLQSGRSYNGIICSSSDNDYFKINLASMGTITAQLTVPPGKNYDLSLYDADQNIVATSMRGTGSPESIEYNGSPGTYYISVVGNGGVHDEVQPYTLSGTWTEWIVNSENEHYYKVIEGRKWDWQRCEDDAQLQHAHLVTINNSDEQYWLLKTFPLNKRCWIGYTDDETEGDWKWSSGEVSGYENWNSGEPNNTDDCEDYAIMRPDGTWNDVGSCSPIWPSVNTAIIEKTVCLSNTPEKITCEPNNLVLGKEKSGEVDVVITGADGCLAEGVTVNAVIYPVSRQFISVLSKSAVTDSDGKAKFTIQAKKKKGKARVHFKAVDLTMVLKVKVVK